jgi:hypothetical protein
MNHEIFLPLADEGRASSIAAACEALERQLDHLSPATELAERGGRIGLRISSARVGSSDELWKAVEPLLPAGMFEGPQG